MPGKSQSYSDAVLNVLRGTSITGVSPYLGLFSVAPGGRQIGGNRTGWQRLCAPGHHVRRASDRYRQRSGRSPTRNNIQFGPAAADWLQAVAFGVFDAQSNGNLLYWNTLTTPKTIQQGDFGQFAPGSLDRRGGLTHARQHSD